MKRIYFALIAAIFVLASCEEWDQVFTTDYGKADVYEPVTMTPNTTIAQLKALYKSGPVKIEKDIVIGGQVVSEDRSGNVYKSIYIQDATGGIELKIGKNALYNDYKLGQWVYVKCGGLTLGAYYGMIQLGYADPTGEYETSYIEVQYIIDTHIFRGKIDTPLQPKKVSAADLLKEENIGCYVELDGLTYANETPFFHFADYRTAASNDLPGAPAAKTISITHSESYRTRLSYNSWGRSYKLEMYNRSKKAYENTVDELTGKQLTFDNVVVCFADIAAYAGDSHDVQSVNYVAGGQAYLFTRGGVQVGRWEKPHPTHPLKLYTETGEEMTLNRGKTYLALVDNDEWSNFSY